MTQATFSELRNHARKYFDKVERGQVIAVYRHGKPIAVISPFQDATKSPWRLVKPLTLPRVSLSRAILANRRESR